MSDLNQPYLREYRFIIRTASPVFVGSGEEVNKKEYIYNRRRNTVSFLNMWKFFKGLRERNLLPEYEDYMLKDDSELYFFMRDCGISQKEYSEWIDYTEEMADPDEAGRSVKSVNTFIKDPYGNPYIPGSSLKGALRNMFMTAHYMNAPEEADRVIDAIRSDHSRGKHYLADADRMMNNAAFRNRRLFEDSKPGEIINDIMRGFVVSDSEPLSREDLCVCKKVDISLAGQERPLNLMRECLRPGVNVSFTITIDSNICDIKGQDILNAINDSYRNYREEFMNCFGSAPKIAGNSSVFFLGGGAGYVSKTSLYGVMHGREARRQVGEILNKAFSRHNHLDDAAKGASPHMLKCTNYNGQLMQMGACNVQAIRRVNKEEMNG